MRLALRLHPVPAEGLAAVAAAADCLKPRAGRLVGLAGGSERAAEPGAEPCFEEGEDHGEVGGHDGGETFSDTPRTSQLCTVNGVLDKEKGSC